MNYRILILIIMVFSFFKNNGNTDIGVPLDVFKKVEQDLSLNSNLTTSYFDDLLKKHPNSDYLIGMKIYYLNFNISPDSAKNEIKEQHVKSINVENGSFFNLGVAVNEIDDSKKLELLKKSLKLDVKSVNKWVRLELYYYYLDKNKNDLALSFLKEAIKIDPKFPLALIELSNTYVSSSDFESALKNLEKVEKEFPSYIHTYLAKANALTKKGNPSEAVKNYQIVLKLDSSNAEALIGLGNIYKDFLKDNTKAIEHFKKAVIVDSNNADALGLLGSTYIDTKQIELAIEYLEKSIKLKKTYDFISELIFAYIDAGKLEKAEDLLQKTYRDYNEDYRLDFFGILIAHLRQDKKLTNDLINQYHKTHKNADFIWLKEQLANWNISVD